MKVLHIINSHGLGGAETMVKDIVTHFPEHKVFCLRRDDKDRFAVLEGRVVYGTTHGGNYKYNPAILWKIIRMVRQERPDILHVHLANSLAYGLAVRIFFPKIKFVYHEHGEIIYNKALDILVRFLGGYIPHTIAVSGYIRKAFLLQYGKADVSVFKNYTDVKYFFDTVEKKYMTTRIGFVGRLTHLKGCDVLVYAIAASKKDLVVLFYGDGPDRKMLEILVQQLGISHRVVFKGYESDRKEIYRELDIVVIPSRMEAASLVNLEARAAGCVVVASRVGGIPEYINDGLTGFLFEPGSYIELARILDQIVDDTQLRAEITERSLVDIQRYDISSYMARLDEFYTSL